MKRKDWLVVAPVAAVAGVFAAGIGTSIDDNTTATVTVSSTTVPAVMAKPGMPAQPSYPGQITTPLGSFPFAYDTKTGILLCPKPPGYNGVCLKHPSS